MNASITSRPLTPSVCPAAPLFPAASLDLRPEYLSPPTSIRPSDIKEQARTEAFCGPGCCASTQHANPLMFYMQVIAPNKQAATIVCAKDSPDHRAASVSENASRYGNLSMLPAMAASCLDNEPPMPYASNTCERDERGALIMFVSDTFGGRASGKACVNVYGILDQLQPFEDDLMVDKGFNIDDRCTELGVGVIQPPFLRTQTQFS
nr:uncharacterized protein LOC126534349 isoform X1 [Dermacentor andersoni]